MISVRGPRCASMSAVIHHKKQNHKCMKINHVGIRVRCGVYVLHTSRAQQNPTMRLSSVHSC